MELSKIWPGIDQARMSAERRPPSQQSNIGGRTIPQGDEVPMDGSRNVTGHLSKHQAIPVSG